MACNFIIQDGKVIDVRTDEGKPSALFAAAQNRFQDIQKAIDFVAITKTDDFEQNVSYEGAEPSFQIVLDYVNRENAVKTPLSPLQLQDLKNSAMSVEGISSLGELQTKLQDAFYTNNLFAPTQAKLTASGLYSPYEVSSILNGIDLQERIKKSIEALNNTEIEDAQFESYFDLQNDPIKTEEFNSFGKLSVANPYIIERQVIEKVGAPVNEEEFYSALSDLDTPSNITFSEAQKYVRAEQWIDNDGVIERSLNNNTFNLISQTKTAQSNSQIIEDLNTLINAPQVVLDNNSENARNILANIESNLATEGLDVIGIKDELPNKEFLTSLRRFLINPSVENTQSFADVYDDYFQVDVTPKTKVLKQRVKDRSYVYLETKKPQEQLYSENSLLKVGEDLYIKVRKQPLTSLYETLLTYPDKFPEGIGTLVQLQAYVQQRSAELEVNTDAEEITLMKMYFDAPLVIEQTIEAQQEIVNNENFTGNSEYLQNDFISDFYSESLKQKLRNSEQYKNFYSNFEINEKGIILINDDAITLDTVNTWVNDINKKISNNIKQYSIISTQMPVIGEVEQDEVVQGKEAMRALAVNYPLSIAKPVTQTFRVDADNIIIKNSEQEFIKSGQDVYENIETKGGITLYSRLPRNESNYKMYKIPAPKTNVSLQNYGYLETSPDMMTERKYISTAEKVKINQENFNC